MSLLYKIQLFPGEWVRLDGPVEWLVGHQYRIQERHQQALLISVGDAPNEADATTLAAGDWLTVTYRNQAIWARTAHALSAAGVEDLGPETAAGGGGGSGGGGSLAPNAAQESGGNLDAIREQLQAGVQVSVTSVSRTASSLRTSAKGATPAGCTQVSFANKGTAAASVGGDKLDPGDTWTIDAQGNDTLNPIAYDATGTTLLIATVK